MPRSAARSPLGASRKPPRPAAESARCTPCPGREAASGAATTNSGGRAAGAGTRPRWRRSRSPAPPRAAVRRTRPRQVPHVPCDGTPATPHEFDEGASSCTRLAAQGRTQGRPHLGIDHMHGQAPFPRSGRTAARCRTQGSQSRAASLPRLRRTWRRHRKEAGHLGVVVRALVASLTSLVGQVESPAAERSPAATLWRTSSSSIARSPGPDSSADIVDLLVPSGHRGPLHRST